MVTNVAKADEVRTMERLEKVLPNVRSYVLDQKPGDPPTNVKILEFGR